MFQRPVMFGAEVAPCAGMGTKGDGGDGEGEGGCGCGEGPGGAGPTPGFVYATQSKLLAAYLHERGHVHGHPGVGVEGMPTENVSDGTACGALPACSLVTYSTHGLRCTFIRTNHCCCGGVRSVQCGAKRHAYPAVCAVCSVGQRGTRTRRCVQCAVCSVGQRGTRTRRRSGRSPTFCRSRFALQSRGMLGQWCSCLMRTRSRRRRCCCWRSCRAAAACCRSCSANPYTCPR